jgi:uncharacterized protein (TIGR02246 family)
MNMNSHSTLIGLLTLGALAGVGAFAARQDVPGAAPAPAQDQAPAAAAAPGRDEAPVRDLGARFVEAYNRRDADAVAALFTDDARIFDDEGRVTEGRPAIRARFAGSFETTEGETLRLEPGTIRFLTDDVAVEDGVSVSSPAPGPGDKTEGQGGAADERRSAYTATHVRRDGTWLTAEVRDRPEGPAADGRDDGDRALDELAWLVGEWVDEDDAGVVQSSCRRSDDRKYLLREFRERLAGLPPINATQRIGWDPVREQIRSWAFDSDGGFTEGHWTRVAPDRWVIKTEGFVRDGRTVSATHILARVGPDSFHWSSVNRVVGDEASEDVEDELIVRRSPAPDRAK